MRPADRSTGADATEWGGRLLVLLQFGLLAGMAWRAMAAVPTAEGPTILMLAGSAALAFWALTANRPGNFNIRPTPRPGGELITDGPYCRIRHPMYASVLIAAAAAVLWSRELVDLALWVVLLIVLLLKAGIEERALLRRFPDYQDYKARTKRFVPWLI